MPLQNYQIDENSLFFGLDKSGSYIKICTREHFHSFMVSFMVPLHILILRGKIALKEKSFTKKEREHKDSGKKKFATAEND